MAEIGFDKIIGQMMIVGFKGTVPTRAQLDTLARIGVGGVILFKQNYESVAQLVELTNAVQRAVIPTAPEGLPAWIAVDHEGGRVQRFGAPFTTFAPAAVWGKLNSPKTCFEAGYVQASELRACGVSINFSPVVDVPPTMEAPGLGDRVFSTDAETVANLGSATIRGIQKGGILGVAKHFPGHGSANVDSHIDLPVCTKSVADLEAVDWVPFRRVIRARADGVMTAHMLVPSIDPDRPATLSRKILQDHLRKGLRHTKLIFSDDLDMGAIRNKHGLKDAAFLAVEAGCDHLLICHSFDELEETWTYLVKAVESGALPQKRILECWERIAETKKRYLLPYAERQANLAEQIVGCAEFKAVAEAIAEGRPIEKGPSVKDERV
jgi:beta-N-acetylhexosaminidase